MINFIIHAKAGRRQAGKAKKTIEKKLSALGIPYAFYLTERQGHATELARDLCRKGETTIVAVGGDGTLHEVLNGLENFENVKLGLIPCGTGNDFATAIKIPKNHKKALDIILSNNVRNVDFFDCSGIRGINIMGTGIDVDILHHYNTKRFNGKIQYFLSLLHCLIHYKPYEFTIIDENGEKQAKKAFIACVANGHQFGGGIKICPDANIYDGTLDMIIVNDLPKKKFPGALLKLTAGKIRDVNQCEYAQIKQMQAVGKLPIQIDGEIYNDLEFNVKLVTNTLQMFTPEK